MMHKILFKLFFVGYILGINAPCASGQYGDNPLKNQRWMTYTVGMGTMDYISWTTSGSYSKRGETLLTQVKLAYSQEFIESENDTCTSVKNRLAESGILWGDGYAWKHGYLSGALGFGFNIRFYCDQGAYEDRYISALTIGLPAQIEAGFYIGKQWSAGLVLSGNWNLRAPYLAAQVGVGYRLKKLKPTS
jgi:hypothetical protein